MLIKPLFHHERTGHFPVLPHQLLKILIVWLALSVVTAIAATAEDTIIVIPTVNSDVQAMRPSP